VNAGRTSRSERKAVNMRFFIFLTPLQTVCNLYAVIDFQGFSGNRLYLAQSLKFGAFSFILRVLD
jgi:hypothetical protein